MRDQAILLIKHHEHESGRSYWVVPGGGREDGESDLECVRREMKEETNLDVEVLRLLLNERVPDGQVYKYQRTYLCRPVSGKAKPGYEPEVEANSFYSISEVKWFDLREEISWDDDLKRDPITYPILQRIRRALEERLEDLEGSVDDEARLSE